MRITSILGTAVSRGGRDQTFKGGSGIFPRPSPLCDKSRFVHAPPQGIIGQQAHGAFGKGVSVGSNESGLSVNDSFYG